MAPIWEAEMAKQFPQEIAKLKGYEHKVHFFMFAGIGSSLCTLTQIFNGFVYKVDITSTGRNVREVWWSPNVEGFVKLPSMTFNERSVADAISEAWAINQLRRLCLSHKCLKVCPKQFRRILRQIGSWICVSTKA